MSLHQDPTQTAVRRQKRSLWTDAWRRMRRSHTAVIGMILFALIVIVCFSAPLFSDYDAQVINSDIALIRKYPVEGHPLGTDELGRDLLLRILWGGRTSITIALAATVVSSVLGIILGAIPAYYGGATDVAFIIKCERANKLRRTYFFTQKRRRGYEIRVLKARGAADYRGNVRKGRKAGRDCRACRQVPSDHIPRARARQDRGNGLPLSSRV